MDKWEEFIDNYS